MNCLTGLIRGLDHTSHLQFMPAISERGRMKIAQAQLETHLKQGKEQKKIGFVGSLLKTGQEEPLLFLWFFKCRHMLVGKSNLYFNETTSKMVLPAFNTANDTKTTVDYMVL